MQISMRLLEETMGLVLRVVGLLKCISLNRYNAVVLNGFNSAVSNMARSVWKWVEVERASGTLLMVDSGCLLQSFLFPGKGHGFLPLSLCDKCPSLHEHSPSGNNRMKF